MNVVTRSLSGGKTNAEKIPDIERTTLMRIDDPAKQYSAFFLCIILSAIIATCGIAAESTAIVIGAMLIAPLMSPMIGTSFAITTGKPRAAIKTLLITLAGTATVIAVAWVVSFIIPTGVTLTGNNEVTSRISPRVVDLIVAIASGVVGALAIGRDDIINAIPGVAIAVSIAPPLCVVGAALSEGDFSIASGALLLFVVNFFAIQLAGNLSFFLMGFAKRTQDEAGARARRIWYVTATLGTLLLAIPLAATSNQLIEQYSLERGSKETVRSWLADTDYEAVQIDIKDKKLVVEIAGEGDYPSMETLQESLNERGIDFEKVSVRAMREYHTP